MIEECQWGKGKEGGNTQAGQLAGRPLEGCRVGEEEGVVGRGGGRELIEKKIARGRAEKRREGGSRDGRGAQALETSGERQRAPALLPAAAACWGKAAPPRQKRGGGGEQYEKGRHWGGEAKVLRCCVFVLCCFFCVVGPTLQKDYLIDCGTLARSFFWKKTHRRRRDGVGCIALLSVRGLWGGVYVCCCGGGGGGWVCCKEGSVLCGKRC